MKDIDTENDEDIVVHKGYEIAKELERLRQVSFDHAKKKERIPQPLFWSLFNFKIKKIKKEKAQHRVIKEVLDRLG